MVSRVVFTVLVGLVAIQRIAEMAHSRRNEQRLRAAGAVEHERWQVTMLALIHGGWLVSSVAEVWLHHEVFRPWLATVAMTAFAGGQILRLAAISTLGERWTVGVLTLPEKSRVTRGLYSRVRHPNYVGVVLEMVALPLAHGAVWTALVFSVLNAIALIIRVDTESRALARADT